MKKMITAALLGGAIAGSLLGAGAASADTPPPVAPGPHHFQWAHGQFDADVAWDCGPDCFSLDDRQGTHDPYRFDGVRWVEPGGTFTFDGITFTNTHGINATLT